MALSLLLLVAAFLLVLTLVNLRSEPLGFDPAHVLTFKVDPSRSGYGQDRLGDFYESALTQLQSTPGLQSASASAYGLLTGGSRSGSVCLPATKETKQAEVQVVAPAFFETMRIPLLAGRGVEWSDRQGAPRVAVVNEAFAKSILSNTKPIGERLGCGEPSRQIEVIGVVGDAKYSGLRTAAPPTVYLPIRQQPLRELTFAVRTTGDPAVAATASRTVLGQLDANIPMYDVASQIDVIAHAIGRERLLTRLLATFGLLALLLACIGIYATLAHVVAQRTRDIGVRIALGASRARVTGLVVRESLIPVAMGLAVGVAAALALTRILSSLLFRVAPSDPLAIIGPVLLILVGAGLAAWIPARRAARVEPATSLRG